jgi:phosphoribosylaminoimidazolecarboxamide formyltransferase / IMP cyclohydrolase
MTEDLRKDYRTMVREDFPERMEIAFVEGDKRQTLIYEKVLWDVGGEKKGLRYGENPGQPAALYRPINGNLVLGNAVSLQPGRFLASDTEILQSGKHPGKTNLTDADNALNILRYLDDSPAASIMKHNNPSGVAQAETLEKAYLLADQADRIAAFGGCIGLNRPVDRGTAEAVVSRYAEVVLAPDFEEGVLDIFARKKNLRVLQIRNLSRIRDFLGFSFLDFKSLIDGGLIVQGAYVSRVRGAQDLLPAVCTHQGREFRVQRPPAEEEIRDMLFGWWVELGITSNSVIYVKDRVTVGIGTGEQDRVGVAEIARDKAYRKMADRICFQERGVSFYELQDEAFRKEILGRVQENRGGLKGSVMVSDAFFPFRDGVEVGLREGVRAVIQPGGSDRDFESIEACNEYGAAMVFTGQRCFKH